MALLFWKNFDVNVLVSSLRFVSVISMSGKIDAIDYTYIQLTKFAKMSRIVNNPLLKIAIYRKSCRLTKLSVVCQVTNKIDVKNPLLS